MPLQGKRSGDIAAKENPATNQPPRGNHTANQHSGGRGLNSCTSINQSMMLIQCIDK